MNLDSMKYLMKNEDNIRWQQRFSNYKKALTQLVGGIIFQ